MFENDKRFWGCLSKTLFCNIIAWRTLKTINQFFPLCLVSFCCINKVFRGHKSVPVCVEAQYTLQTFCRTVLFACEKHLEKAKNYVFCDN